MVNENFDELRLCIAWND